MRELGGEKNKPPDLGLRPREHIVSGVWWPGGSDEHGRICLLALSPFKQQKGCRGAC